MENLLERALIFINRWSYVFYGVGGLGLILYFRRAREAFHQRRYTPFPIEREEASTTLRDALLIMLVIIAILGTTFYIDRILLADLPSAGAEQSFFDRAFFATPPPPAIGSTIEQDEEGESKLLRRMHKCPRCDSNMLSYLVDESRKLHICGNNPDCGGFEIEKGQFKIKGYDGPVLDCDKCGAEMQLKSGRFGKYFGCMECKNTRKLLRSGEPAPPKADPVSMPELKCEKVDDHYLLRDGASGIFLAASQFPKHRETRAPKVSEIIPHANELDPKFNYLVEAPEKDPDGNPSIIRYSRKTKEQYVQTEIDGKATGWKAFYQDGKWVEQLPPPKKKKKAAAKKPTKKRSAKKGKEESS